MDEVAATLQRDGVKPGDAVANCARTSMEYAVLFLGALRAGAAATPLAPSSTAQRSPRCSCIQAQDFSSSTKRSPTRSRILGATSARTALRSTGLTPALHLAPGFRRARKPTIPHSHRLSYLAGRVSDFAQTPPVSVLAKIIVFARCWTTPCKINDRVDLSKIVHADTRQLRRPIRPLRPGLCPSSDSHEGRLRFLVAVRGFDLAGVQYFLAPLRRSRRQ
jgi:AMP-binding enzyme